MTRWPLSAKQAAHTVPTYPNPNTLIRIRYPLLS
jgi:hypothetical protein